MTRNDDQPVVLGVKATVWVTGLALALVSGAGAGAWRSGLFDAGQVRTGTVVDAPTSPTTPASPQAAPSGSTSHRAAGRVVTLTATAPTTTPTSRRALTADTVTTGETVSSTDPSSSAVTRTDCPTGFVPDDVGGCVVDHSPSPGAVPGGSPASNPPSPAVKPITGPPAH